MDNGTDIIANNEALQILLQQFETLLIFLQRPAVYRQLFAFVLVMLGAYIISVLLDRIIRRFSGLLSTDQDPAHGRFGRWILKIALLYFPISGLIGMTLVIQWFQYSGFRFGILRDAILLFWVIFAYRIIITSLVTIFSEPRIQPYNRYILNPLFVVIVTGRLLANLLDLNLILQIELANFLETSIKTSNKNRSITMMQCHLVIHIELSKKYNFPY